MVPPSLTRRALLGKGLAGATLVSWRGSSRGFGPAPSGAAPWRVLALQPLSGPHRPWGEATAQGLSLWAVAAQQNGVAGRPVELELLDTESDPETAGRLAWERALDADLVVAPYGSPATAAVLEATEALGIPLVAPAAGEEAVWTGTARHRAVQLLPGNRRVWEPALARAAAMGLQAVVMAYRSDPFTLATVAGAQEAAARWGLRLMGEVGVSRRAPPSTLQAATARLVGQARDSLAQDSAVGRRWLRLAVLGGGFIPGQAIAGFAPDAAAVVRGVRSAAGGALTVTCLVAPASQAFADWLSPQEREGVAGVTTWQPWLAGPQDVTFVQGFRRAFGRDPDSHAAFGYAAGQVFEAAALAVSRAGAAGAVSGSMAGRREALAEALRRLRIDTLVGSYQVDPRGLQVGIGYRVAVWRQGRLTVAWPPDEG